MTSDETMLSQNNSDSLFQMVKASGVVLAPGGHFNKPFDNEKSDNELLHQVINYYHETLKSTPVALKTLQKMGIDKSEVIDQFKLGLSDRTFGHLLPEKNRREGAALRGRLQRLGILKPSGHELFRGSLVVPVFENGVVKQIYGYKLSKKLRPGTPVHTYLSESSHGLFNSKAVQTCDEVIICSSMVDVLTFWCAGYKNVTCSYAKEVHNEH
ncbi:hypothetical protein MNBD_GAMMA12-1364 [hydrothermal vent metagenome]|uniref:DNA primase n=1 Tax=hydrothermal vent metagenome TaxID=652676 RepID=A0A3B0YJU8_9ZZZZ